MSFLDVRFPTGIKYGASGGPMFNTRVGTVVSGRTQRNQEWSAPLRRFRVDRALTSDSLRNAFLAFFYTAGGRANTFRLKDFGDFEVISGEGVFTTITSSTKQLVKRYTNGAYTKDIDIVLPVNGSISVPGFTEGVDFTVSYTTGVVTLVGSPTPNLTSWTGEYDVLCRFNTDELQLEAADSEYFLSQTIEIIEERL